jgi:hypothetical protein
MSWRLVTLLLISNSRACQPGGARQLLAQQVVLVLANQEFLPAAGLLMLARQGCSLAAGHSPGGAAGGARQLLLVQVLAQRYSRGLTRCSPNVVPPLGHQQRCLY